MASFPGALHKQEVGAGVPNISLASPTERLKDGDHANELCNVLFYNQEYWLCRNRYKPHRPVELDAEEAKHDSLMWQAIRFLKTSNPGGIRVSPP